jgi:hypothetical protein
MGSMASQFKTIKQYRWSASIISSMVKEDGNPVTTLGDIIFKIKSDPVDPDKELIAWLGDNDDQAENVRNVAFRYSMWNGHANMDNSGQEITGMYATYLSPLPSTQWTIGTYFLAYRITATPTIYQCVIMFNALMMRIMPFDTAKFGFSDIDPYNPISVPLGTNGTICVVGLQFATVGSETDLLYICTDDTSVTRIKNSWLTTFLPAGSKLIRFALGAVGSGGGRSPPMEWYEVRYYATNRMSDQEMIDIRDEIVNQFA